MKLNSFTLMSEIELPEIPETWITLLAVLIAGAIALFNLRHSIRLQARNKWKEDFRLHISDYLETYMSTLFNATKMKAEMKSGFTQDTVIHNISLSMSQLTGRITRIQMMLEKNSKDYEDIDRLARYNNNKLQKILAGDEEAINIEDTLANFFKVSKRIYDSKK